MIKSIRLFLALSLAFSQVVFSQPSDLKGSAYCSRAKSSRPSILMLRGENSPRHTYDVLEYTLDVDLYTNFINPFPKSFKASNVIHLRVDTTLNHIKLNASNFSLQIDSVGMAGISFDHTADTLMIILDQTYYPGDSLNVKVYYSHKSVTDNAFFVSNGMVFTDCEPQGARNWFPCWDQPSDKATLKLTAKVPSSVKLGSNGRLADSLHIADTIWYHWISKDPMATYLVVMAGRVNYNLDIVYWPRLLNPQDTLPIRFYYNPGENPAGIENMIGSVADFFSGIYGDHPFEKDGFATLNNQFVWGGMENQTLTTLEPNYWSEMLVVHEFSHQWFGDMITCGTWADLWLNEGFATYSEALWIEHRNGYDAYKDEIDNNAAYYLWTNPGWALYIPSWAFTPPDNDILFNYAITYLKSSCVLHLFRYVVGDPLFFDCIYQYTHDSANFRYQSVITPDFITKMNEVTGEDYTWFFTEWIYHPNHPVYANTYNFIHLDDTYWRVRFKANQVQDDAPFFKMPLELRVVFNDASDTLIRVFNSQNNQVFEFDFNRQPQLFFFDPNNQIVLKEASTVVGMDEIPVSNQEIKYLLTPNPFKHSSRLHFLVREENRVTITLLDLNGQLIDILADENKPVGEFEMMISGEGLSAGVYLLQIRIGSQSSTAKMVIR